MENFISCIACGQDKPLDVFNRNKTKCDDCYREYHRLYQQKYRLVNRSLENQRARELYQINKNKITARKRRDYQSNKDKANARKLAWQKANPEMCRLASARRRATKNKNGSYRITAKEITVLLEKPCFYCDAMDKKMTIDHIIPISRGGCHSIGNLVTACFECNASKNAKTIMEWRLTKARINF